MLMRKREDDCLQNQVICFLLFFEQFSLYQMDKEGNTFGMKKLGHFIMFIHVKKSILDLCFLSILTLLSKIVIWELPHLV